MCLVNITLCLSSAVQGQMSCVQLSILFRAEFLSQQPGKQGKQKTFPCPSPASFSGVDDLIFHWEHPPPNTDFVVLVGLAPAVTQTWLARHVHFATAIGSEKDT